MRQSTYLRKVLHEAIKQGWTLTEVNNGGDDKEPTPTVRLVMAEAKSVDCCHIFFTRPNTPEDKPTSTGLTTAWIFVVWQGPDEMYKYGEEICSDYTVNLKAVFAKMEEA